MINDVYKLEFCCNTPKGEVIRRIMLLFAVFLDISCLFLLIESIWGVRWLCVFIFINIIFSVLLRHFSQYFSKTITYTYINGCFTVMKINVFIKKCLLSVNVSQIKSITPFEDKTEAILQCDNQKTEAPTQKTEMLTQKTEAPTQETEAPTQKTEAPTQKTEAPTQNENIGNFSAGCCKTEAILQCNNQKVDNLQNKGKSYCKNFVDATSKSCALNKFMLEYEDKFYLLNLDKYMLTLLGEK